MMIGIRCLLSLGFSFGFHVGMAGAIDGERKEHSDCEQTTKNLRSRQQHNEVSHLQVVVEFEMGSI